MEEYKGINPELLDAVARARDAIDNCRYVRQEVGLNVYSMPVVVIDIETISVLISVIEENWKQNN